MRQQLSCNKCLGPGERYVFNNYVIYFPALNYPCTFVMIFPFPGSGAAGGRADLHERGQIEAVGKDPEFCSPSVVHSSDTVDTEQM